MISKDELEKLLIQEERHIIVRRTRIATSMMAIPLVLSFSAVDYFFARSYLFEFFMIRLIIVPVSISAFFLLKFSSIKYKYTGVPAYIVATFLGVYNTYLVMKTGAEQSAYYAGLNLVAIGGVYFLPLMLRQLCILIVCIFAPYYTAIFLFHKTTNYQYLITNSAFMFSTAALCLLVNIFNRKLRRSEIEAKVELENELKTKEEIIRRKTQEGIYLEKLTAQFSPQIIEGIKLNQIDLEKKIRKEITCIFVDIVNSTDKSVRLDHNEYTSVISDFFTECINIFLKHNVTVGTYLGDGIMAFTNAPQDMLNHEENALKACLEILSFYNNKKKYYSDLWKGNFSLRIGLNSGYAYIGFFPSLKRGTYTAIGEVVNLTSRLCTIATENSICVTKNTLLRISSSIENLKITKMENNVVIKGFENDHFDLFSIKPQLSYSTNSNICPLCSSPMAIGYEFDNCILVKCTKCKYTDIKEDLKKVA